VNSTFRVMEDKAMWMGWVAQISFVVCFILFRFMIFSGVSHRVDVSQCKRYIFNKLFKF
jgi:hypothetical protein